MMLDHALHISSDRSEWCLHAIGEHTYAVHWVGNSYCGRHRCLFPGPLSRWHEPPRTKIHCIACYSHSCPAFQWCRKVLNSIYDMYFADEGCPVLPTASERSRLEETTLKLALVQLASDSRWLPTSSCVLVIPREE
ncbi:hypothetical protein CY34DRAFT_345884 [Suillus luteus UH-Slu-Lm8-n1]|uniref:Uncharacterized protein n=1 Tax=Suillus luteus UH-Slu-Lm8-n1 TaxID=930992 RepID=A0A0D0AXZ4_9AGAM|nr:hypothetical protein CY34DRAFT_345884 [Suillus luteus UH-Slu-Lm8-n1]